MAFLLGILVLASCGSSSSTNNSQSRADEFRSIDYPSHASDCGNDYAFDKDRYSKAFAYLIKTTDFSLVDKYPDIFEYDESFDTWKSLYSQDSQYFLDQRVDALACIRWMDSLSLQAPEGSKYPNAWLGFISSLKDLRTTVEQRLSLIEEMHNLLPAYPNDKKRRNAFFAIYSDYWQGYRNGYESHMAIRQILEYQKFNGVDFWIATCPTFVQITDLYGQIVTRKENGLMKIVNNTDAQKTFSGQITFRNADGIGVASQNIDVTLPAGKEFNQELRAIEGNDTYSGTAYPISCDFSASN